MDEKKRERFSLRLSHDTSRRTKIPVALEYAGMRLGTRQTDSFRVLYAFDSMNVKHEQF